MTAHELARELLAGPDLPVFVHNGIDPSDWEELVDVIEVEDPNAPSRYIELSS